MLVKDIIKCIDTYMNNSGQVVGVKLRKSQPKIPKQKKNQKFKISEQNLRACSKPQEESKTDIIQRTNTVKVKKKVEKPLVNTNSLNLSSRAS